MNESPQDNSKELELLHGLLTQFSSLQSRFGEILKSSSIDDAFHRLAEMFMEILNVSAVRGLEFNQVNGRYPERFLIAEPGLNFLKVEDDAGLVEWAVENDSVMLVPVEDEKLLAQGLSSMIIMPIQGKQGYGVLLMWVRFDEKTASKFITDLLRNTAHGFASFADNKTLLQEVQSVHQLMNNILESVPQGIFAIDHNDRVIACNRDIEILFGVRRIELLNKRYQEVFPEDVVSALSEYIIQTLNGEEGVDHELKLNPGEGSLEEVVIGVSISLLYSADGKPHGLVFICRDLSLSLEVQRLREIDVMKSEFIHTVSHELKTPLTAIMGGAEVLVTLKDEMPESCREMVNIISEGGNRLHSLIMDLLDLSRLESGRISIDQQTCDMPQIIFETVELLKSRNAKISWNTEAVAETGLVLADNLKMKQVMENLIGNAVKYSPQGGQVIVSAGVVDDRFVFKVKDEGIGIPPDQVPLVWDKFYRVDSSTTAEIEGTGLGLPIVKHIVEMHRGEITLESDLGKGSEFGFWIPSRMGKN